MASKPVPPAARAAAVGPVAADPRVAQDAPVPWRAAAATRAETAPLAPPAPAALVKGAPIRCLRTHRPGHSGHFALGRSPGGRKIHGREPADAELELAPGSHRIEIRNGQFKPYFETLELAPNQTIRIQHKFSPR